jgi:putative MFS transporter
MSAAEAGLGQVRPSSQEAAVGEVLDGIRTFRHRWLAPGLLGVILLFDTWDVISIAYAMPSMAEEWKLEPLIMGFIISAGYVGQFLGAVTFGGLAERFGRMPIINFTVIAMSLLALACAMATNYHMLIVLRLVQGVAIGAAVPVAVTYINELAPTKIRGSYTSLFQVLCMAGAGAASVSSIYVVPHLGWRWMFGLGAAPLVLLPLAWLVLPESPRWLARIGRLDHADKSLVKLGGTPANYSAHDTAAAPAPSTPRRTIMALFSPELRGRTIAVALLWGFSFFVSHGTTTWMVTIYVTQFHIAKDAALQYAAIYSMIYLVALSVSGALLDKIGRRPPCIAFTAIGAVMLAAVAIVRPTSELLLVATIITGQLAMALAATLLWPFTAETFPTDMRALAVGCCSSIGRAAAIIAPSFVGFVLNGGGHVEIVFLAFAASSLCAFIIWITQTRETAGRPLDAV